MAGVQQDLQRTMKSIRKGAKDIRGVTALVDGVPGAVWAPGGQPRVVFAFTIRGGRIVAIDILADPERLRRLDLATLED